jgi:membrane-associated protease RseP (regulator of RpoE activity)
MLRFSLLGVPVGVHWSFALIGLFVLDQLEGAELVGWVMGVFLAILVHEMGHALTARHFGAHPVKITLFTLGGLTQYPADTSLSPGQRFLIAASGSAVGMTFGGALFLGRNTELIRDLFPFAHFLVSGIIIAGFFWGALNWLPILPLDGGNMAWHALEFVTPRWSLRIAKVLTIITASVVAYLAIAVWDSTFGGVFVGIIALQGLRMPERTAPAKPRPRPAPVEEESLLSIFDKPQEEEPWR